MNKDEYMKEIFTVLLDSFKGYQFVRTFAITSSLMHSIFSEEYEAAICIKIDGTPVVWANPIANGEVDQAQQLFVPSITEEDNDALRRGRRTMSLLSYASHGLPVKSRFELISRLPGVAQAIQPYASGGLNGYDLKRRIESVDFDKLDADTWTGLAYHRLAVNADSEYYEFLSWWQIIELFHGNNDDEVRIWVNQETSKDPYKDWIAQISHKTAFGRMKSTREKCAHIANSADPKRMVIADPDDPGSIEQVMDDIPTVRSLAESLLKARPGIELL